MRAASRRRAKDGRRALLCVAALVGSLGAGNANAATCDPWPGEPVPLPTLTDPDPLRAEWASLRALELATVARRFEAEDPVRARQMWRRLLCMEPANDEALAGVLRSSAVRLHRPALLDAPIDPTRGADPWESLAAPIGVQGRPRDARDDAIASELRALRTAVGTLEAQVRAAQFDEALANAPALRARLERAPAGEHRATLLAQTEVLAATAELAIGRAEAADASLRRALAVDPALALDPATTAPKVLRALDAARAGGTQ